MPGVGITDARQILHLVGQQRSQVGLSVVLQLLSAACYAPALAGVVAQPSLRSDRSVRWAASLLLIGAMGSAADAVFHLLAYAMTSPGLDRTSFTSLMQVMQGPGLRFILPLIAAFFTGSLWLSVAFARQRLVSGWNPRLHVIAFAIGLVGVLAPAVGARPGGRSCRPRVVAGAQARWGRAAPRPRESCGRRDRADQPPATGR
jgi:hypothetical protein